MELKYRSIDITHFFSKCTQEGMFNNANVIFRTKFVDGVSTVTRTIGTGASSKARALAEAEENGRDSLENRKRPSRNASRRGKENEVE